MPLETRLQELSKNLPQLSFPLHKPLGRTIEVQNVKSGFTEYIVYAPKVKTPILNCENPFRFPSCNK